MPLWRAPQHQSRAAMADAGAKQLGAVPWLAETRVGLELAGLTDDQITRALAEQEQKQAGRMLGALLNIDESDTVAEGSAGEDVTSEDGTGEALADDADPAA